MTRTPDLREAAEHALAALLDQHVGDDRCGCLRAALYRLAADATNPGLAQAITRLANHFDGQHTEEDPDA